MVRGIECSAHLGHWLFAVQPPFRPNLLGSSGLAGSKFNWDGLQVLSQPSPVSGLQKVQMLHCAHIFTFSTSPSAVPTTLQANFQARNNRASTKGACNRTVGLL